MSEATISVKKSKSVYDLCRYVEYASRKTNADKEGTRKAVCWANEPILEMSPGEMALKCASDAP